MPCAYSVPIGSECQAPTFPAPAKIHPKGEWLITKPVCLILGADAGIGGHANKRFAREDFHVYLAGRNDKAGLDRLVVEIQKESESASGMWTLQVVRELVAQRFGVSRSDLA